MTKSDISYASVPTASSGTTVPPPPPTPPMVSATTASGDPYIEGFQLGSSHAVTVIVDENTNVGRGSFVTVGSGSDTLDYSRRPVNLKLCPNCHAAHVRTSTRTYPNAVTWGSVVIGAFVFFPLCWIPLVVDSLKQTDHYCQSCGKRVATVKALDGCFVKERL